MKAFLMASPALLSLAASGCFGDWCAGDDSWVVRWTDHTLFDRFPRGTSYNGYGLDHSGDPSTGTINSLSARRQNGSEIVDLGSYPSGLVDFRFEDLHDIKPTQSTMRAALVRTFYDPDLGKPSIEDPRFEESCKGH